MLTSSTAALLVGCDSLEEASVAIAAIKAFREGGAAAGSGAGSLPAPPNADAALATHIEAALNKAPMNQPKTIVMRMLRDGSPEAWVSYPDMCKAFQAEGLDPGRAAAALRDLSWQMGQYLPPQDTAGLARKIEVMAERSRAGGVYRYRLTKAGRAAVERFLGDK